MLTAAQRTVILSGGWWFPGSALDLDFQLNRAAVNGNPADTATSQLSITRATVGMAQTSGGLWQSFASGAFRLTDLGLLVEEARTNVSLWNTKYSDSSWTKGNGGTGSVPTITDNFATAPDGTATAGRVQLALNGGNTSSDISSLRQNVANLTNGATYTHSVWLKSNTGSSYVIQIIDSEGTSKTNITVTPTWQQFQISHLQTSVNGSWGIWLRGANSNSDSADILIWADQNEIGAFATSPILITNAAATRNADVVQVIGPGAMIIPVSASAFFQGFGQEGISTNAKLLSAGPAQILITSSTNVAPNDSVNAATATLGSGTWAGTVKAAFGLDNTSMTAIANGGTKVTQSTSTWTTSIAGQTPYLGNQLATNRSFNGYLQRAAFAVPKGIFDNRTSP